MKRLFPNWTYRCASRWLVIGGIVAMLGGVAIAATHAKSGPVAGLTTSPSACKPGVNCPPPPPPPSFAMTLAAPVAAPVAEPSPEPANGLSTSPSAPASTQWYATAAAVLIGLIGMAKKSPKVEKFFATDGIGMASSFVVSAVFVFGEALSRGESPSWVLAKHAVGLTAAMFLGYAGILKRIVLPLARQAVTKVLGIPVPGWLA